MKEQIATPILQALLTKEYPAQTHQNNQPKTFTHLQLIDLNRVLVRSIRTDTQSCVFHLQEGAETKRVEIQAPVVSQMMADIRQYQAQFGHHAPELTTAAVWLADANDLLDLTNPAKRVARAEERKQKASQRFAIIAGVVALTSALALGQCTTPATNTAPSPVFRP